MRPIYLFLKFLLKITLWIYYPRFKTVNRPKRRFTRTIFMCNHAASFMDPLVVASKQKPIVFFMTRADIYSGVMKQIFWAAHMLPIYRQMDGGNTKDQNQDSFDKSSKILKYGRSLLIFAEGFTDDVFIRRLKPIKKGAVRLGFSVLEKLEWKKNIYLQAVGVNYSNPNLLGSDCLISNGNRICLNDYKSEYQKNPSKVIRHLNEMMEKDMRNQITDIRNAEMSSFHENIMRLTRKGMNAVDSDKNIPLVERWKYSKQLSNWMNETEIEENQQLISLKERLENYFKMLEENRIEETPLYCVASNKRKKRIDVFYLAALFPFMLIGLICTYLPNNIVKKFVEKSFKRKVFWGSVKMLLGFAAVGIYNLLLFLLVSILFKASFLMLLIFGIVFIPPLYVLKNNWFKTFKRHQQMNKIEKMDTTQLSNERNLIINEIYKLIPVA